MIVRERLKELRKEKGVNQNEIAEYLGKSLTGYASYEQGKAEPSIDVLLKLAQYYNVSIDYLVGMTDIQYTDHEKEFADKVDSMTLEECLNQYSLMLNGKELPEEESKKIIKVIKVFFNQD